MYIATQHWRKQFAVQTEDSASTKAARYQKNTQSMEKISTNIFSQQKGLS